MQGSIRVDPQGDGLSRTSAGRDSCKLVSRIEVTYTLPAADPSRRSAIFSCDQSDKVLIVGKEVSPLIRINCYGTGCTFSRNPWPHDAPDLY